MSKSQREVIEELKSKKNLVEVDCCMNCMHGVPEFGYSDGFFDVLCYEDVERVELENGYTYKNVPKDKQWEWFPANHKCDKWRKYGE